MELENLLAARSFSVDSSSSDATLALEEVTDSPKRQRMATTAGTKPQLTVPPAKQDGATEGIESPTEDEEDSVEDAELSGLSEGMPVAREKTRVYQDFLDYMP